MFVNTLSQTSFSNGLPSLSFPFFLFSFFFLPFIFRIFPPLHLYECTVTLYSFVVRYFFFCVLDNIYLKYCSLWYLTEEIFKRADLIVLWTIPPYPGFQFHLIVFLFLSCLLMILLYDMPRHLSTHFFKKFYIFSKFFFKALLFPNFYIFG